MSLPELATPIRIYWDLTPLPAAPPDHERIAAEIIDLRILNADLVATGSVIPAACPAVVARLMASRISVTLTVSPGALNGALAAELAAAPPKELLVEVGSLAELDALLPLHSSVAGIAFPVDDGNWQQLPGVVSRCGAAGLKRLVVPMQRLYDGEEPFHIPREGLAQVAAAIEAAPPAAELRITVHDPFIWRAIFPRTPFPEGRCQAANTMLAIDSRGLVYPCPVMPLPLGDLATTGLKEIARGAAKKELRARLLRLPRECAPCPDADACKGGCRGRGERLSGSWDSLDPGCR